MCAYVFVCARIYIYIVLHEDPVNVDTFCALCSCILCHCSLSTTVVEISVLELVAVLCHLTRLNAVHAVTTNSHPFTLLVPCIASRNTKSYQHQQLHWSVHVSSILLFMCCCYMFRRNRNLQGAYTDVVKTYSDTTVVH